MGDAIVVRFAVVDDDVRPTGFTKHSLAEIVDGEVAAATPLVPFAALAIARYAGNQGFYLLYLDREGNEVTDTWHRTLEDAMRQAEVEFEGITSKWIDARAVNE